jgi:hypothetical protein
MSELPKKTNSASQLLALTRFRALNFVEDRRRQGCALALALREASLQPWPDENGDYYAVRTLEDWWYAYQKHGFEALVPAPRSDQGKSRVLDEATAALDLPVFYRRFLTFQAGQTPEPEHAGPEMGLGGGMIEQ